MKRRFTQEQIAFALRQAEGGTAIEEILRRLGISEATFYRWKRKYAGLGVAEMRRLRQLEFLDLSLTGVTDEGLKALQDLPRLRALGLAHTRITGPGLGYLAGLTELRYLCLGATAITDTGLRRLKGLKQMRRLGLAATKISAEGLVGLKDFALLETLVLPSHLGAHSLGREQELKEALPGLEIYHSSGFAGVLREE